MTQNHVSGMETCAVSVLKRAVELDQEGRFQESLVCYQEGIQLLMDVLKAVRDDSKRGHYRQRIKGYMDRAEQIKAHVNQMKEEGKYHEQIKIAGDATGYSYEALFKPYISSALTEVWVEDPYIRHTHQLYNFLRFCEMLLKGSCKVKRIHLLTSQDETDSGQQTCALSEIKESLSAQGVTLDVDYSSSIHDREIRFDNGWIIKIGRGLDYFKRPKGRFSIGYCDYDLRQCHETNTSLPLDHSVFVDVYNADLRFKHQNRDKHSVGNFGFYEKQGTGTRRSTAAATATRHGTRHMETFLRDTEESTDDIPGRKKSKLKSLKTRLFRKSKKAGERSSSKLSQSASDITSGEGLGSDEDLVCTQGIMGSRALSHDSIFLADLALTDAEPSRVLSQENVQSKIKALQQKLQQQKLHLGQPPIVLPIRRPENQTCRSEDDAHNPSEMSEGHITTQEALNKALSQLSPNPLLPTPKTAPTKSVPSIVSTPPKPTAPVDELPLDFSTPAQFTPSLDTSAARHRMSVKPRNQRASTKKRLSAVESTSLIADLNNTETVKEEDRQLEVQEEVTVEMGIVDIPFKLPETTPVLSEPTKPETTSKTSSLGSPQQDITILEKIPTVTSQILRPKPHRSADVMPAVRPHSSFISSEVKGKSERSGNFVSDKQDKTWTSEIKSKMVSSEQLSSGPGSVLQPTVVYGQTDGSSGIKRPVPGAGLFHLSVAAAKSRMEAEGRPRSGSFTGICEHAGAWLKTGESSPYFREKGDIKPNESTVEMERLRQETAQHKTWETTDSLGKVESVRQSKHKTTDIGESEGAVKEVEEEEGKTTFGIKLRATSQSIRTRAEVSSNEHLKSALTEEKQQKQEISINANHMSKKTSVNVPCTVAITGEAKPTDVSTAPSAVNVPAKQTPQSSSVKTLLVSTGGQSVSSNSPQVNNTPQAPQEPQPVPHASPTEVSWMSLAMEKTRSLQSLFTNKFPRDFTGVQTSARSPKIQVQTMSQAQAETQTQSVKNTNQPSMDAVRTETLQHKSQAQTVKQSLPATTAQQRTPKTGTSQSKSDTSKEAQISKPTEESQPTLTEPVIQPVAQSNMWTSQSPLRSIQQVEGTSQSPSVSLAQSGLPSPQHATVQKPPWSTRSLRTTGLASTSPSHATPVRVDDGAANVQEKEDKSVWAGSVSKKAAFLEKRAEWTTSPAEVKKTESLTPSESSAQSTPQNKDAKAGGSAGVKHTESSPRKIPERPKDEKWLQKTTASSSCPTSSPTLSSSLQSMSDTREPSWMELAKRKSMAWSDKTMD